MRGITSLIPMKASLVLSFPLIKVQLDLVKTAPQSSLLSLYHFHLLAAGKSLINKQSVGGNSQLSTLRFPRPHLEYLDSYIYMLCICNIENFPNIIEYLKIGKERERAGDQPT